MSYREGLRLKTLPAIWKARFHLIYSLARCRHGFAASSLMQLFNFQRIAHGLKEQKTRGAHHVMYVWRRQWGFNVQ